MFVNETVTQPHTTRSVSSIFRDTSPAYFLCLSNHLRDLSTGGSVSGQTFPFMHWYMWELFWVCFVNFVLIDKNYTGFLVGNCKCNISELKYYIFSVCIIESNVWIHYYHNLPPWIRSTRWYRFLGHPISLLPRGWCLRACFGSLLLTL
jgi:hypothetical protein